MRLIAFLFFLTASHGYSQHLPIRSNKTDGNQKRQGEWAIWMDAKWQPTTDSTQTVYYRLIQYKDDKPIGITADYYRSGTKQYEGVLLEDRPQEIQDGVHTWYYQSGEKRIIETFAKGESQDQKIFLRSGVPADPEWVSNHYRKAERFSDAKNYTESAQEFLIALENAEAFYGRESEEYASVADWLGIVYGLLKENVKSIYFMEEFVAVRKLVHAQPDTLMLTVLEDLGSYYKLEKNWAMAKRRLKEFLNYNSSYFQGNHPAFADAIQVLGTVCEALNEYDHAVTYLTDAKRIFDANPKKYEYPRLSNIFSLSSLYQTIGEWAKGEQLLMRELPQLKKDHGATSEIYCTALGVLARIHEGCAKYKEAEAEWLEELRLVNERSGEGSREAAGILGSLAEINAIKGNLGKADQYIQRGRKIYEQQQIPDDYYFEFLAKLSVIYSMMGNKPAFSETIEKRREVAGKLYGAQSLEYARALLELADDAFQNKNWQLCEAYAKEAISIYGPKPYSQLSEPEKTSLLLLRARLGTLYLMQHLSAPNSLKLTLARQYLEGAIAVFDSFPEKIFSLNITDAYLALATVFELNGDKDKADRYYDYVHANVKRQLGESHPYLINLLFLIAKKSEIRQDLKASNAHYQKALDVHRKYIANIFPYLSETEKEQFYESNKDVISGFYGFAAQYQNRVPGLAESWCNLVLSQKGIILQSFNPVREAVFHSGNAHLQTIFAEWQKLKNEYGQSMQDENANDETLRQRQGKLNDLEKEISQQASAFNLNFRPLPVTWKDIQKNLAPGEAAVEIVYAIEDRAEGKDTAYHALVIKPGIAAPHVVRLVSSHDAEGRSIRFYRNAIKLMQPDVVSYNLFWKPLERELAEATKVYWSADGIYHQINPATLFNPASQKYLQEERFISAMPSTTWLVNRKQDSDALTEAVLFAHPHYGSEPSSKSAELTRSLDLDNVVDLPGTGEELNGITALLRKNSIRFSSFEGDQASEEAIKKIKPPPVLHIATHGFFLPQGVNKESTFQNPLLRSGLLFADCQKKPHLADLKREDGILTAFEASTLPLYGTKLVVLSACETGLGEVKNGEGVYGLQRAFFMAGAERVLMSLWKVDDEATRMFMVLFYEQWIQTGNVDHAFQRAQQSVKSNYPNPFYWGAFVLSGR